jgi:hypothetical protein
VYRLFFIAPSSRLDYERTPVSTGRVFRGQVILNLGCSTKVEISTALARVFPELVWRLPPERKAWESEHPRQTVFDAIALGLAYWQHETNNVLDSQDRAEDRAESL